MTIKDYDYHLPEELVAQYPPEKRGGSRLLVVNSESYEDLQFKDILSILDDRYFLILNDTSVLPARLPAHKPTGGAREVFYLQEHDDGIFQALVRGKIRHGDILHIGSYSIKAVVQDSDGSWQLQPSAPVREIMANCGEIPLPPYIHRTADANDKERYQTVYAAQHGSVAAPTAGLHFTDTLLAALSEKGVEQVKITLHVGIGTFRPIQVERLDDHKMHAERYFISQAAADRINELKRAGKIALCVGTTTVRAVESAASDGLVQAGEGISELFINPGYKFQVTQAMLTNFHLPRSSLMVLVAALIGHDRLMNAYRHAVKTQYRFYSYGDAMLVV